MVVRLSEDARKVVLTWAAEEALRRGDRRLGTDHLLLGILRDPGSEPAKALGVDLESARAAEDALDRRALVAIGVEVGEVGEVGALGHTTARRLPPLTSGARAVLKRALSIARPAKTGRIETGDFLLALLDCQMPDPAAELLKALGVDNSAVRQRLSR